MITYIPPRHLEINKAIRNAIKKARRVVREFNRGLEGKDTDFLTGTYKHIEFGKRTLGRTFKRCTVTKTVCERVVVWMENASNPGVLENLGLNYQEMIEVPDEIISEDEVDEGEDWQSPPVLKSWGDLDSDSD